MVITPRTIADMQFEIVTIDGKSTQTFAEFEDSLTGVYDCGPKLYELVGTGANDWVTIDVSSSDNSATISV